MSSNKNSKKTKAAERVTSVTKRKSKAGVDGSASTADSDRSTTSRKSRSSTSSKNSDPSHQQTSSDKLVDDEIGSTQVGLVKSSTKKRKKNSSDTEGAEEGLSDEDPADNRQQEYESGDSDSNSRLSGGETTSRHQMSRRGKSRSPKLGNSSASAPNAKSQPDQGSGSSHWADQKSSASESSDEDGEEHLPEGVDPADSVFRPSKNYAPLEDSQSDDDSEVRRLKHERRSSLKQSETLRANKVKSYKRSQNINVVTSIAAEHLSGLTHKAITHWGTTLATLGANGLKVEKIIYLIGELDQKEITRDFLAYRNEDGSVEDLENSRAAPASEASVP